MTPTCGCRPRVALEPVPPDGVLGPIIFCPLHAKAQDMRALLLVSWSLIDALLYGKPYDRRWAFDLLTAIEECTGATLESPKSNPEPEEKDIPW